jgi:signal peptidase I
MEARFSLSPEYDKLKEYPVAIWLLGLLAMVKSVFWLVGETDVVSYFFLNKYILTGILYFVFGVGVINLRRWALKGLIALSVFDIAFFLVFPDSKVTFFPSLGGGGRFIQLVTMYGVSGFVGSLIMLGLAFYARDFFGKSLHFRDLLKTKKKSAEREYTAAIIVALLLALIIRAHAVQAFKIPTGSMENTLLVGDHLLVTKFIYGTNIPFTHGDILPVRDPERGDVVVFKYPENPKRDFIKRIVGVGGDVVESRDQKVYVNGILQKEPYAIHLDKGSNPGESVPRDNFGPIVVPEGKYFMMGDNRDHSYDSRYWGFVDRDLIEGKALVIYWSWDGESHLPRLGRMAKLVE